MSPTEAAGESLRAVARIAEAVVSLLGEAAYVVLGFGVVVGRALRDAGRRMLAAGTGDRPEPESRKVA
jgi:hypothetical protein